ncbi:MAG TPA: AAA domain-containing protein, partial [Syntrophorhabdus sp.]|nr:AAA domain-containing protein [Syntrophorhabdus sp.]
RHIYRTIPDLSNFTGISHEKIKQDFINLDREIISLNGKNYAYEIDKAKKVPLGVRGYRVSEFTEMELIYNEINKKKRHIPIRQLMKRAGRAIQALKPCFMMGPLSVAQYLEQGVINFDLVIMDEASQLKPEEALGAIIRARQVVVVGDPKQLPPTSFFDRMAEDGDDDEEKEDLPAVLSGSDSILDICQQIFRPVRTLRWHYRSRHHSLIAFSNHHFYDDKLLVFPSPYERNRKLGLRYRYIDAGVYRDRQNIPEAQRVVDAIVEHMINNPGESLGVVTLNLAQRDLIEDIFEKKLRNVKECQKYIDFWEEKGWPFFIKNLENVQGDERDVIFISTTFGKVMGTDKVRQNFGPISRPFGWRRLNVLFTRAKERIELFTSMQPEDIIVDEKTPAGTRALRDYLDYAKRGQLVKTAVGLREPDSDFEIAVGQLIKNKGYDIVHQLGVAGYFIDIAVRNPDRPGEYLAAIECDGSTYHSSKSARDRDRIRQEILESLGWEDRIWRIWSCDWFYDPRRESERLFQFLERCREKSKTEPAIELFEEQRAEEIPSVVEKERVKEQVILEEDPLLSADLFVEVGDQVTYCFTDKPNEKKTVMIVDSPSNTRLNLLNEKTPVAQALLDLSIGEENELILPDGRSRIIKVLKIHRQERLGVT